MLTIGSSNVNWVWYEAYNYAVNGRDYRDYVAKKFETEIRKCIRKEKLRGVCWKHASRGRYENVWKIASKNTTGSHKCEYNGRFRWVFIADSTEEENFDETRKRETLFDANQPQQTGACYAQRYVIRIFTAETWKRGERCSDRTV